MKLLTHNMLACHIKTVKNGFPFKIEATKVEEIEADFDPDFLRHIFPRIEYKALREAAETLGAASFSRAVLSSGWAPVQIGHTAIPFRKQWE